MGGRKYLAHGDLHDEVVGSFMALCWGFNSRSEVD